MKRLYLFLMAFISLTAWAQEDSREFSVLPGQNLKVSSPSGGNITVKSWAKNTAQINVFYPSSRSINSNFNQEGNTVSVVVNNSQSYKRGQLKIECFVPKDFNLELKTSGGNLDIGGINGNINGKTSGGNIALNNVEGEVNLRTSGGNYLIEQVSAKGSVETSGGNITVNSLTGNMQVKTSGGNIILKNSSFQGDVRTSGGNISFTDSKIHGDISTSGGDIEIDQAPEGAKVHTSGGDISINSAQKYVYAKTSGGDIQIKKVDGWIEARTSGGDIYAKMIGNPQTGKRDVTLNSSGGDITLYVPAGLSMNIDLKTNYNLRYSNKKPVIESDFPLEKNQEGDNNNITLSAKGRTGNASHNIIIKTSGGSIYLKKNP